MHKEERNIVCIGIPGKEAGVASRSGRKSVNFPMTFIHFASAPQPWGTVQSIHGVFTCK